MKLALFPTTTALLLSCILLSACSNQSVEKSASTASLKDVYKDSFLIGTAIGNSQLMQPKAITTKLIQQEFNAATPENDMKWERIHPLPGVYDFAAPDKFVEFAQANNIFITGHTLLWHSQAPDWVFEDEQGNEISREALLVRLKDHIDTVVGRYKGRVQSWDVVNEALNEDGSMRQSKWYKIIGDDMLEKAFEYAHAADPDAELYYNDYNLYAPQKRAGAVRIVQQLKAKGLRIDGVGMQGHYSLFHPEYKEVEDSIIAYAAQGVKVMFTEVDISVLVFPEGAEAGADVNQNFALQEKLNPYSQGLTPEAEAELDKRYSDLFEILLRHEKDISRVTFWGTDDGMTWRNNWPMKGRSDYPLLFDRQSKAKSAYYKIMALKHKS
ncbi:endo-1,4-beta-xylanase [Paraglaciecola hydrolytica]|uniref:Beta-xylanase n=1 Tax=Paraglaciecola hydrolytica TaxID=1799789 RepID=A0A136A2M6_9ALTE|nr:endo-1,4-beta-xylanase [Paraglaciecola hydrolytica]KXI29390.1 1,4-beta-xylanase [Paraglaciecola hydrolytica]